jgi:hypothetical protein
MDGTIICQGSFVAPATIVPQIINIPSGVDWMRVINYTQKGIVGAAGHVGNEFYWQRGMAAGTGVVSYYANGSTALVGDTFDAVSGGGFTLYDPSGQTSGALPLLGNPVAATGISNATRPVVSTANTNGLSVGSVVRLSILTGDTALASAVSGIDFVVGAVNAGVSFTLLAASNALANAPALTTGSIHYTIVNYNPLYYPYRRTITNITQATNAQVSTSVPHGLTPGQQVRFHIPRVSGMTQLNPSTLNNYYPMYASSNPVVLSVVDDYNFTINTNTSSYTAFTFPTVAQMPSGFPQVVPYGENTAASLSIPASQIPTIGGIQIPNTQSGLLADATTNTGIMGMILGTVGVGTEIGADITGPAGTTAGDVIYWLAGKSTFGGL